MNDERLELEVGFPFDLPSLASDSTKAKKEISGVGETADHVSKKVLDRIAEYQRLQDNMANAKGWAAQVKAIKEANMAIAELHGKSLEDIFSKIMDPPDAEKLHARLAGVADEFDQIDIIVDSLREKLATIEPIDLADKDEVAAEVEAIAAYNNQMRAIVEEAPRLSTQLSSIKNAMADLAAQNKENTEEYRMLKDMAGQLEEAIKRTNEEIRQAASPTAGFDTLIRATSTLVAGFNILQGAAALFGKDNEEIQKSILKVTAAMSILQGLQQIQLELKKKDSVFTVAQTIAQRAYAIAVGQSVGAMRLFRLALIGMGIGAIVVGIIALVQHFREMRMEADLARKAQEEMNEAMADVPKSAGKARQELDAMAGKIRLAKEGVISKTGVLKEYNDSLGKTFGAAKNLNEAEEAIIRNGDAYIEMTLAKAKAMAVAELAAKKYTAVVEEQLKSDEEVMGFAVTPGMSDAYVASYRRRAAKARAVAVEEKRKEYEAVSRLQVMYEYDLSQKAKQTGLTPFTYTDPKDPAGKKVLDDRVRLLNEIAKAEREIRLDRLEQNAREIEEIRYKYQVMRDEAKRLGLGTEVADRIDAAEGNEISDAIARQDEAEAAKRIAAAKARLDGLLKEYATYEQKRQKIIADSEKDIADLLAAGEKERADERQKVTDQRLLELDKAKIEGSEAFIDLNKTLSTAGSNVALQALKSGKDTVKNLIKGLKDATGDQKAALTKLFSEWFDTAIGEVEAENFQNFTALVEGFGQLVESAGKFDGSISSTFKTIGQMVTQVGKLSQTLSQTFTEIGGSLSKGGGIASIVGAVLSLFGSISEAIEASYKQRAQKEKEAADFQMKQLDAVTRALEYQLQIIQDIYGIERVKAYSRAVYDATKSVNESIAALPTGQIALQTGDRGNDQLLNEFNKRYGSLEELNKAIDKASKKADNFWHKFNPLKGWGRDWATEEKLLKDLRNRVLNADAYKFEWQSIEDITQEEITKLEDMLTKGMFDDITASKVRNIIDQFDLWREATNKLNEELTGTSFEALLSDTSSLFFNAGGNAGEAWTDGFDKIMEDYLIKKFNREFLESRMQGFYDLFSELAEDGLTESEKEALRTERDKIWDEGNKRLDDLRDTLGVDKPAGSGSATGISGRINRTIEESTASEILGFERARYDLSKRSLVATEEMMRVDKQLYDATLQSIRHQAAIEQNTADTVVELRSAVVELKAINKNTKQGSTSYDRP